MSTKTKECPSCQGKGTKLENPGENGMSPFPGFNPGNRMVEVPCRRCRGTGRIPEER